MQIDKISNNFSNKKVYDTLLKNGICVLKNFLDKEKLLSFQEEFKYLFHTPIYGIDIHEKNDSMTAKTIDLKKINKENYNIFNTLSQNNLFNFLSTKYLSGDFFLQKIMIQKTSYVNEQIAKNKNLTFFPHTDETHFLKFFIYVDDVNSENGPFNVLPGSQNTFKKIRKKWISSGKNRHDRDKIVKKDLSQMIPVTGKAGTLIIFDTDVAHNAGIVDKGHHRSIVRFDFYSPKENCTTFLQRTIAKIHKLLN